MNNFMSQQPRGMNNMPTYRRGRQRYDATGDKGGLGGILSLLFVLILLIGAPACVFFTETAYHHRILALQHVFDGPQRIGPLSRNTRPGDRVHFAAEPAFDDPNNVVSDPAMHVQVAGGAVGLSRKTEYCQWQEIRTRSCEKCTRTVRAKDGTTREESYECHCVTNFNYVKAWRSHRILSLGFDQPAAHHNPQRDPMPSQRFVPANVAVKTLQAVDPTTNNNNNNKASPVDALLDGSVLSSPRAPWRRIEWNYNGMPPVEPSWFAPVRWGWWKDRTRYEPIHNLRDTEFAPAAMEHQFTYVGGGYFFSPYTASQQENLFKWFMQYMEGSLLDWQLGDLMPSCTAGDVRFYYQVQDPTVVSVLGQVMGAAASVSVPVVESVPTPTGPVGMVHSGIKSVQQMFQTEERDAWWKTAVGPRVLLLLPWSIAMSLLVRAFLGQHHDDGRASKRDRTIRVAEGTASVWLLFLGGIWMALWGSSVDSLFALVSGVAVGDLAYRRSPAPGGHGRPPSGGFNAVWCMIGRWAKVPPSWRVENSYGSGTSSSSFSADKKRN